MQTTQFGKIIASDGGLTPSHLAHHHVVSFVCMLCVVICFALCFFCTIMLFSMGRVEMIIPIVFTGFATGLCVLSCFLGMHQLSVEKKTNITVCENGIIGESLQSVLLSLYWLESVRLPYETITAVDSHEGSALGEHFFGKTITIHSSGRQYRFMVKKPAEIQQAIFEQRYRLQQQRQSQ